MAMTKKIKMLMLEREITQTELAKRLKITQPTLSAKFALDDWRESDLREIAEVCHCKYEGKFILSDKSF